jgi:Zn-dependent M28 family amino/carboxypeptidase
MISIRVATRVTLIPALSAMLLAACGQQEAAKPEPVAESTSFSVSPELQQAAATISADDLRTHIAHLSSDEMGGRGVASPGGEAAMQYLEAQLKAAGFQPGGDNGTWRQAFDVVGMTASPPKTWTFARGGKKLALKWWDEYIASSGVQAPQVKVSDAELVFVGYGIQAPEYRWDDFKGMDLKGKVLVMLNSDPDWDEQVFGGKMRLYYGRWTYKYESAARQGAAGAIIVHTVPSAGYPFQVVQTSWTGEQFELPDNGEPRIQIQAWTTQDAMRALFKLANQDLDQLTEAAKTRVFKPVPLGITTSISFANAIRKQQTANILGVLPGSDPALQKEAVVYTAHHDHLGIGEPDSTGDKIYNGALDNGSGMAQLLSMAKALKALPQAPKRSSLMLFVAAEEQGLLGSEFYATHPTFPAGKIAANLNFDGGNIWGKTRDITFVGKGKSNLDAIVDGYAKLQGRIVLPDQMPDRGFYYRSDQFNFAKVGVPAVYFDGGTDFIGRPAGWGKAQLEDFEAHRYHQPSDELQDDWTFDGMIEDTQLGLFVGVHVANQKELPVWNVGDEFEAARKAAIAATAK